MTVRRVLLPSELPDEALSATSSDWGVIQVNGETKLRKIRPGVLPPKSVGTAEIADEAVTRAQIADSTINAITGWSTAPVALGSEASAGSATTISRSDHVHPYPSASNVGALPVSGGTISGNLVIQGTTELGNTLFRTNGCMVTASDPIYSFSADTDTGIANPSANELGIIAGGTVRCLVGASGNFRPWAANTYYCGTSAFPWLGVYGKDAYVATSDSRLKTDVVDSDLGLSFIATLRPVSFRWRETGQVDAQGTPSQRPGVRPHYGLIAQEVRQALDGLGHDDFAGYCYDADDDTYALRYSEFIAPLIKAVQELAARVEKLEAATGGAVVGRPG